MDTTNTINTGTIQNGSVALIQHDRPIKNPDNNNEDCLLFLTQSYR